MIDPIAYRVAERIIDKEEIRKRIEQIPGWNRSNFLMSLYNTRYPLSEKQKAVLDKIEKEQGAKAAPAVTPRADVVLNPRKKWLEKHEITSMIRGLVAKPSVTIYDPNNLVAPNVKLHEYMVHELSAGFWGQAEMYAEYNADEDDPVRRKSNSDLQDRNALAGREMENAHLQVVHSATLVTLTLTPSYQEVLRKHKLTR
jgi:hypothetical protein